MSTVTVNISFPKSLFKTLDAVAKQEARSRSELLREGVRLYIERKQRWKAVFSFGRRQAKRLGLRPQDVETRIDGYRQKQARLPGPRPSGPADGPS